MIVVRLNGVLMNEIASPGSKSQRKAFFLMLNDKKVEIRRKDGPAFADQILSRLVGKYVSVSGLLHNENLVLIDSWEEVAVDK